MWVLIFIIDDFLLEVIVIIVLMNICIGLLNNTIAKVTEQKEKLWKFARTKVCMYCTVLCCPLLCTVLHYDVLYCAILCCPLLCTVLYYSTLYCTVLYCSDLDEIHH